MQRSGEYAKRWIALQRCNEESTAQAKMKIMAG
jgi:hypothetical protein